ncbi:hypothetical protein [Vibrio gallaecicus]|nr:hypothetical protein [Vibrio gallaecicus]MDN3614584.1 hypothetical protein [Vibrio gallaecicus]
MQSRPRNLVAVTNQQRLIGTVIKREPGKDLPFLEKAVDLL